MLISFLIPRKKVVELFCPDGVSSCCATLSLRELSDSQNTFRGRNEGVEFVYSL